MVYLYSDVLFGAGGIETYLHALAIHLRKEKIPSRVVVAELEPCRLVDALVAKGVDVYRQARVPGDRWLVRQRVMMLWLNLHLQANDWVFCVRQPAPSLYLKLVRLVHRRGARIGASWMLAPEFLPPQDKSFCTALAETDAVISVAKCTANQFRSVYGYEGRVHVVPYHNLRIFDKPVPLPPGPPWRIGYLGRVDIKQKNLDQLIIAFASLASERDDVELHIHGSGSDLERLKRLSLETGADHLVDFHGYYDHRSDLSAIMARCHFFVYPSRFEGGPCFSLLEMMQAGRFCIASRVGGIPDFYDGPFGAGIMVRPGDVEELKRAMRDAVKRTAAGEIDTVEVSNRYSQGGFDMESAHQTWLSALQLPGHG